MRVKGKATNAIRTGFKAAVLTTGLMLSCAKPPTPKPPERPKPVSSVKVNTEVAWAAMKVVNSMQMPIHTKLVSVNQDIFVAVSEYPKPIISICTIDKVDKKSIWLNYEKPYGAPKRVYFFMPVMIGKYAYLEAKPTNLKNVVEIKIIGHDVSYPLNNPGGAFQFLPVIQP